MPLVIHLNLKYSVLCPFLALFERIGRQSYIMNYFHISLVLVFSIRKHVHNCCGVQAH